ncbi:LOW QUALITY PROTEIN: tetratricopeptide repeat protein 34 [Lepus europaeus]|uniref:LOW QUALITY PROTEIN: tetratricopeptide repeat protein 34 n=1 Tax=Lepus europaeus TaxID=9983 RepID=UPI002B47C6D4|nr:LOW QUALITY PROTEIN: tetratricopeptide repeat protein 34 [Lepus europaeus]
MAQELGAGLCQEGDRHLALGEPPLATAFYLAAFSCHAPSAVRSVRRALAEARGAPVLDTLEAWCRGDSRIPTVHWDGMAVVSLTATLASAFLGALCPDHPAAVLHGLAGLLARGHHEEVARRCSELLDSRSQPALELRLSRALAWVLSGARAADGVADYLRAFAASADRTLAFIHAHQRPYLPALLHALQSRISEPPGAGDRDCWRLLAALEPEDSTRTTLSPEALLRGGRYADCLAMCSQALQSAPAGGSQGERLATLLVTRAAAALFLDGRAEDMLRDLHDAFRESPRAARRQLQAVLSVRAQERVRAQAQEAADLGFARFQEAVRSRPELREDADRELLAPVTCALRILLRVAPPGAQPALGTRLAECLLLAGDVAGARALCERLLRPASPGDAAEDRALERAPLLALRGFCALHAGDAQGAREDFQAVVEQGAPHLGGCVRALCGRGLLRVLAGSAFLGTLDYVTACGLRPEEALLAAKAFVPWNQRGLLLIVLREEGRRMLQRPPPPGCRSQAAGPDSGAAPEGDARGVYQLASLLMELDAEDEAARLLAADALYRLGRLEDAHGALRAALAQGPPAAAVLVRLALLQLRRGFAFDAHQLVKRLVQARDTACLQPTLDVFCREDLQLLRGHCHTRALAILRARPGAADSRARTREAITYLSLAIFAAGSQASESLLTRARCYGLLGQKKTAMFDFNSVLRAEPGNVQALCGRALVHLALGQQQEAVADIVSALKLDPAAVVPELRSLRRDTQGLLAHGLHAHCRALLSRPLREDDAQGLLAAGEALVQMDGAQLSGHLLLADALMALGSYEAAGARLQEALRPARASAAARARRGLLRLKQGDVRAAARDLQGLAEPDAADLGFLLRLLEAPERQSLAQAAAGEASALLDTGRPRQALGFCSLAVLAGGGGACHLRLRATCLAQLRECDRALRDLDQVLQEGAGDGDLPRRAEDLCSRGRLLLSLGDEAGAAAAFGQALTLAPAPAQSSLWGQPGRTPTVRLFLHHGQRCLEQQRHAEAWTAAQSGLLVDPGHRGLKRLKARAQRGVDSGCRLH